MISIFDKNDPIGKMGEILGALFAIMGEEIIKSCGKEEGEKIITRAAWNFGDYRGKKIREKVLDSGEELTLENFTKFSDMPDNNAWDATTEITDDKLVEYTRYCPYTKAWKELGLEDIGCLYCVLDESMIKAYDKDVNFERKKIFNTNKEGHCEMIISRKK